MKVLNAYPVVSLLFIVILILQMENRNPSKAKPSIQIYLADGHRSILTSDAMSCPCLSATTSKTQLWVQQVTVNLTKGCFSCTLKGKVVQRHHMSYN